MFALKQLQQRGHIRSFSVFDTTEHVRELRDVQFPIGTIAMLGDVKQMYTNVEHKRMKTVIEWVLGLINMHFAQDIFVPTARASPPMWNGTRRSPTIKGHVITIEYMKQVLFYDLRHIFFTVGNKLIRQTLGIPMGSPCSPALAVALCMYAEHAFAIAHPGEILRGYRYIDDILVFAKPSLTEQRLADIYDAPLELEIEQYDTEVGFRFLESWMDVHQLQSHGSINLVHFNKNAHRLSINKRPLKNIVHFTSCVPQHQAFGGVVGALTRVSNNSWGTKATQLSAAMILQQCEMQGASQRIVRTAAQRMAAKKTKE